MDVGYCVAVALFDLPNEILEVVLLRLRPRSIVNVALSCKEAHARVSSMTWWPGDTAVGSNCHPLVADPAVGRALPDCLTMVERLSVGARLYFSHDCSVVNILPSRENDRHAAYAIVLVRGRDSTTNLWVGSAAWTFADRDREATITENDATLAAPSGVVLRAVTRVSVSFGGDHAPVLSRPSVVGSAVHTDADDIVTHFTVAVRTILPFDVGAARLRSSPRFKIDKQMYPDGTELVYDEPAGNKRHRQCRVTNDALGISFRGTWNHEEHAPVMGRYSRRFGGDHPHYEEVIDGFLDGRKCSGKSQPTVRYTTEARGDICAISLRLSAWSPRLRGPLHGYAVDVDPQDGLNPPYFVYTCEYTPRWQHPVVSIPHFRDNLDPPIVADLLHQNLCVIPGQVYRFRPAFEVVYAPLRGSGAVTTTIAYACYGDWFDDLQRIDLYGPILSYRYKPLESAERDMLLAAFVADPTGTTWRETIRFVSHRHHRSLCAQLQLLKATRLPRRACPPTFTQELSIE